MVKYNCCPETLPTSPTLNWSLFLLSADMIQSLFISLKNNKTFSSVMFHDFSNTLLLYRSFVTLEILVLDCNKFAKVTRSFRCALLKSFVSFIKSLNAQSFL
jgi:hypothetical protein